MIEKDIEEFDEMLATLHNIRNRAKKSALDLVYSEIIDRYNTNYLQQVDGDWYYLYELAEKNARYWVEDTRLTKYEIIRAKRVKTNYELDKKDTLIYVSSVDIDNNYDDEPNWVWYTFKVYNNKENNKEGK